MRVPPFKQYYASEGDMNPRQKRFYDYWKANWEKGKKISVNNQISYIFCYIYDILFLPFKSEKKFRSSGIEICITINGRPIADELRADYRVCVEKVIQILKKIIKEYQEEERLTWYCKFWLSDCYVLLGDYKNALLAYPELFVDEKAEVPTVHLLNLKLRNNEKITGYDILTLNGANVTSFGKRNIKKVAQYLEILIRQKEKKEGIILIKQWQGEKREWNIFNGSHCAYTLKNVPYYDFGYSENVRREVQELTREAENTVREEMNIPKIGEGWIAETELYYKIKNIFSTTEVIHHARPDWLGNQHVDIFFPKKKIAIEYQGAQHYRPVDFFGGVQAFNANKRRDKIKKQKCKKNKVKLIEVSEGYALDDIIKMIKI